MVYSLQKQYTDVMKSEDDMVDNDLSSENFLDRDSMVDSNIISSNPDDTYFSESMEQNSDEPPSDENMCKCLTCAKYTAPMFVSKFKHYIL